MSVPNLREVELAIYKLEKEESSKAGYEFLASLYTVRQHMQEAKRNKERIEPNLDAENIQKPISPETNTNRTGVYSGSDFLQSISGKNLDKVIELLNEHMEVMRVVNPRAYESVIRKLNKL